MVELSSPAFQIEEGGRTAVRQMTQAIDRFLCIASYEKGQDFMRQCAEMGVRPSLLTVEKLRDAAWPREVLEDIHLMADDCALVDLIQTVCWMCRGRHFDRVIALADGRVVDQSRTGQHAGAAVQSC